jgi:hypothetical protein
MSGDADIPTVALAVERGVDAVLLKPFDLDELRQQVEHSVERVVTGREVARERGLLERTCASGTRESRLWILRARGPWRMAVRSRTRTRPPRARVTAYSMSIAQVRACIDLLRFPPGGRPARRGQDRRAGLRAQQPSPLTPRGDEAVEEHPLAGARILEPLIEDPW